MPSDPALYCVCCRSSLSSQARRGFTPCDVVLVRPRIFVIPAHTVGLGIVVKSPPLESGSLLSVSINHTIFFVSIRGAEFDRNVFNLNLNFSITVTIWWAAHRGELQLTA